MITDEVKALPMAEKMRLMEVLWLDLRIVSSRWSFLRARRHALIKGVRPQSVESHGFTIGTR
jgi:hypothetical protein